MESEKSVEVLADAPQQQEEVLVEIGSKMEAQEEEKTEPEMPEMPPSAAEVNGDGGKPPGWSELTEEEISGPPGAPPADPDESSEKVCDPEPENGQPEEPAVPENEPEKPPAAQTEAQPEKTERLPEINEQRKTAAAAEEKTGEEEEEEVEEGGGEKLQANMEEEKRTEGEGSSGKPAGGVTVEEVKEEKKEEEVKVEEVKEEKKEEEVKEKKEEVKEEKKEGEVKVEEVKEKKEEEVKEEKKEEEAEKLEDAPKSAAAEEVPAPGSLSFALLEEEKTREALRASRTLIVLRGLPGSGKSFLAAAIAEIYKDQTSVVNGDELEDSFRAVEEAVAAICNRGAPSAPVVVVVDGTNHTQDRASRLGELSEQHGLLAVFLEPRTEWRRDPKKLAEKTRRGLEEAQLAAMLAPLEEAALPLFFGWFLLSSVQEKVRCTAADFLKTLDTLEAFKKHLADFTGKAEKEVDLEQYFKPKGSLHCTSKFCDYGKAAGAAEYAAIPAVSDLYGSVFDLSLTALFVTPRSAGARVSLSEAQLALWPPGAEEDEAAVPGASALPRGSRAHLTLGCRDGVEAVQTGLDLLELLVLKEEEEKKEGGGGEAVEEMELGTLRYYGDGRWMLLLREPVVVPACFSSFYGPKMAPVKEPERKKKQKCAIL